MAQDNYRRVPPDLIAVASYLRDEHMAVIQQLALLEQELKDLPPLTIGTDQQNMRRDFINREHASLLEAETSLGDHRAELRAQVLDLLQAPPAMF